MSRRGTVSGAVGVNWLGSNNVCSPNPGGSGGGTCTFTYPAGSVLRLASNSANVPGVFNGGTGDAAACATSTCNITLNNDSSIIASFVFGIAAVICGILGVRNANIPGLRGRGISVIGVVTGVLALIVAVLIYVGLAALPR